MVPLVLAVLVAASLAAPVAPARILDGFRPPEGAYGAGHRGVDLAAAPDQPVFSPIAGTVRWIGRVAGKDVITISDGSRNVSLEPVRSSIPIGGAVRRGELIGAVGRGGHCDARCVHVGLRIEGRYARPFATHARLLP